MKKTILSVLTALFTLSLLGQVDPNVAGFRVYHRDITTRQTIDQGVGKRAMVDFMYRDLSDKTLYPETSASPSFINYHAFTYIYSDPDYDLYNVVERTPPPGYLNASKKHVTIMDQNGTVTEDKILAPNDPIQWERTGKKMYVQIVFISRKVPPGDPLPATESFQYSYNETEGWTGSKSLNKKTIESVRVGEYYWMKQGFHHDQNPFVGSYLKDEYPKDRTVEFESDRMDQYMDRLKANNKNVWSKYYTTDNLTKDYGYYFGHQGTYWLHRYGTFTTEKAIDTRHYSSLEPMKEAWRLPYAEDVRQTFAMSGFVDPVRQDPNNMELNERDIRFTMAPKPKSKGGHYMSAVNFHENNSSRCYWFDDRNLDKYGLGLMPTGWKNRITHGTEKEMFYNGLNLNAQGIDQGWHMSVVGDIAQLFMTTYLHVGRRGDEYNSIPRGLVSLAEQINTVPQNNYYSASPKKVPLRWLRAISDEELDYKIYIKVDGLNTTGTEWKALVNDKNEIPLLLAIRKGTISHTKVDIKKLDGNNKDNTPAGYAELPKGYIRGFYVQYNIASNGRTTQITKAPSEIARYASLVQDKVLGYVYNDPSTYPKTKSAVSSPLQIQETMLKLYPNPMTDLLHIESAAAIKSLKIYSAGGGQLLLVLNKPSSSIDLSHLPVGVYIVQVVTDKGRETHKIIKQ